MTARPLGDKPNILLSLPSSPLNSRMAKLGVRFKNVTFQISLNIFFKKLRNSVTVYSNIFTWYTQQSEVQCVYTIFASCRKCQDNIISLCGQRKEDVGQPTPIQQN